MRLGLAALLVVLVLSPAMATVYWDSYQGDNRNTGTGMYDALHGSGTTEIFNIIWQKKARGAVRSTMLAVDDTKAYGCYGWPSGIQALDRINGGEIFNRGGVGNDLNSTCLAMTATMLYHGIGSTLWATPADGVAASYSTAQTSPSTLPIHRLSNITPGGDILGLVWNDKAYAAQDTGAGFVSSFAAATSNSPCYSVPAILEHPIEGTLVVNCGRGSAVKAWRLSTGAEVWSYTGPGGTDCSVSVDSNGNVYGAGGWGIGNQWAYGVDKDGTELFRVNLPSVDGMGARVQSAGCLSYDETTYYVQTIADGGTDHAAHGMLYAVDVTTGTLKWSYDTGSLGWEMAASTPIATKDGVIFVGNNNGNTIYALQDMGASAQVLATYATAAVGDGSARMNFSQGPDGTVYFAGYMPWTVGAGADGLADGAPDGSNQWLWCAIYPMSGAGPGDVDGNGVVDGLDLTAVLTAWETHPGDPLWNAAADLDGNNIVDGLDLTEVISNWTVAPAAAEAGGSSAAAATTSTDGGDAGVGNVQHGSGNVRVK